MHLQLRDGDAGALGILFQDNMQTIRKKPTEVFLEENLSQVIFEYFSLAPFLEEQLVHYSGEILKQLSYPLHGTRVYYACTAYCPPGTLTVCVLHS